MSDNLANQDKSVKKSKKMETGKASSAKSTSSQETIKTVERSADIVDGEKRKERERHNSGASIHLQPAHRATWSNSHRYTKYRGSSESRRGANHNYSNRDSYVSSSTFDSGNLCRHTSTQSLNSNPSKKIEEEPVEVASSTTSSDAANDRTAPAARIGTLRQNANAAAFSAYAGPAPAPSWEDRSRGGFPPLPTQFKTPRNVDETPLYYEK
uniref:Uncharacterized protein n=1 Tax=Pristionchus pacificus TaxID=54126 RepID=A0A8R1UEV8_PRIPA